MLKHEWKGNVRELINVIEHAVVISSTSLITTEHLPYSIRKPQSIGVFPADNNLMLNDVLDMVEKEMLLKAKKQYKTTTAMAKALGISQASVVRKLKKHHSI